MGHIDWPRGRVFRRRAGPAGQLALCPSGQSGAAYFARRYGGCRGNGAVAGAFGGLGMIRKEAAEQMLRWRDSLVGAGLVALGLWWALRAFGLLAWLGWALVPLGAVLMWQGVRRALFH